MITFKVAKKYVDKGWPVFPVILTLDGEGKVSKKPAVAWREYQERLPNMEELHQWFDPGKYNGIGLATGKLSQVIVVDSDTITDTLDSPFVVKTISGGHHYYFRWTREMRNDVKIEGQKLDFRGDGGFVVLPPSALGEQKYIWEKATDLTNLKPLPDELMKKLSVKNTQTDRKLPMTQGDDLPRVEGIGTRNQTAAEVAGMILSNMATKLWETVGWTAFKEWNNTHVTPPLDQKELQSTWESIVKTESRNHPDRAQSTAARVYTPIHTSEFSAVSLERQDIPFTAASQKDQFSAVNSFKRLDALNAAESDTEWIWNGYLAKGYITLFSALWKVGKTTLLLHLLKAMQENRTFAGRATSLVKVAILSEESENIWCLRRDNFKLELPVWVAASPIRRKLNYNEWCDLITQTAQVCKNEKIELLIIDTLPTFWNVDNENDASKVQSALLPLNALRDNNIAVLLIHHFRKGGGEEGTAPRGSGALSGYADILMEFTRMPGETESKKRVLKCLSRFDEPPEKVVIELSGDNEEYKVIGTQFEVARESKLKQVEAVLATIPGGATVTEIRDKWPNEDIPAERSIRNYLSDLDIQKRAKIIGVKMTGTKKTPIWDIGSNMAEERQDINVSMDEPFRSPDSNLKTAENAPKNGHRKEDDFPQREKCDHPKSQLSIIDNCVHCSCGATWPEELTKQFTILNV